MFKYHLFFNTFYILLTNIIIPNIAIKDVFYKYNDKLND